MKRAKTTAKTLLVATLSLGLAAGMTSCKKEGCTDSNATNYNADAKKDDGSCQYASSMEDKLNNGSLTVLSGAITKDVSLPGTEYTIAGGVHVKDGVTLTIKAGTTIKNDPNEAVAYLLAEQGAKIMAVGTADAPIVFTSGAATPARGDWGGIILCGKAPVNGGTRTAEVGDVTYGGTDATDNSGHFEYVRLEYTGNVINSEKQHNGFTFNGCGNQTIAKNLQVYMGKDDGFEWFGGTIDECDNLVSTGSLDDSYDWTYGWSGGGTNWYAQQANDEGDRGIEGDNDSKNNSNSPYSNPSVSNVTLAGRGVAAGTDGMKLREGTKGNIQNVKIMDFKDGLEVEHAQTVTNVVNDELLLSKFTISGATKDWAVKAAGSAADSTAAAAKVDAAVDGTGTGATDFWTNASWIIKL